MAWIIADRDIGFAKERAWLPIEPVPNRLDPTRHHFVCPGCSRRVATLVFKSGWACRLCHGMAYRRQLIPKSVIAAEAAQAIDDQIGRGRPAGMHHKTFARLVAERDEQRPLAGGIPPEASLLHERVISPEWVAFDDFELWFDDYMARSGKLETVIWPD